MEYEKQLTKSGFHDLWVEQVRAGFGFMKAYDNAEIMHYKEFGKFRYSDYKSFARSRDTK